jgi:hypothetical protein
MPRADRNVARAILPNHGQQGAYTLHGMPRLVTGITLHSRRVSKAPGAAAWNLRVKLVAGGVCAQESFLHLSGRLWMAEKLSGSLGCEFGLDFDKFLPFARGAFSSRSAFETGRNPCALAREIAPELGAGELPKV